MMNISALLNPSAFTTTADLLSPPLSPNQLYSSIPSSPSPSSASTQLNTSAHGKPRSRFSELEDAIICDGVANGLTWGQISNQLPHRKRATCFNRYRTLQGIRKSRKRATAPPSSPFSSSSSSSSSSSHASPRFTPMMTPPSAHMSALSPASTWTSPSFDLFLSSSPDYTSSHEDILIRRLPKEYDSVTLPPICCPIPQYPKHYKQSQSTHLPYLV